MNLDLNLNTIQHNIALADVPFGTYRRIECDVHKVKASEVALLSAAAQGPFLDFLTDGGKTVIIRGRVYKSDGPHDFTFNSALNMNEKLELSPVLDVSEDAPLDSVDGSADMLLNYVDGRLVIGALHQTGVVHPTMSLRTLTWTPVMHKWDYDPNLDAVAAPA